MIRQFTFDMCKQWCTGMQRSIALSPPKVHLMLKHVACQMRNIWGGGQETKWRMDGTPPSDRDASTTVLPHCLEPGHLYSCMGEGKFPFIASRCDCSHRCNKRREQAFLFCHKNQRLNFNASKKAARYGAIQGDDIFLKGSKAG
jgi:hypothetical protein